KRAAEPRAILTSVVSCDDRQVAVGASELRGACTGALLASRAARSKKGLALNQMAPQFPPTRATQPPRSSLIADAVSGGAFNAEPTRRRIGGMAKQMIAVRATDKR